VSRHGFHSFTSSAPVFGTDEDSFDPFYDLADPAAPLLWPSPPHAAKAFPTIPLSGLAPDQFNEKDPH
jgi:hypothetical protein